MIAPTAIIRGTGMTFGMPIHEVEGATGFYDSNLDGKAHRAIEMLTKPDTYDFGFLHIKAIDDAGHDKNLQMKITQLEKVDRAVKILVEELGSRSSEREQYIICITGDHTTPIQ
jgi:2,3-bisphosphoglycerate-independent phosphoglycerate mutase